MNFAVIRRTLGWLLIFEAIFMLVPTATAVLYEEWNTLSAILASMGACLLVGAICLIFKVKSDAIYAKEGMVIVASSWIVLSLFGALPFWFSREIPSYIDALFEAVSGFTTTGATILTGEVALGTADGYLAMSKSLLMWRSFTHWVGGMGILVFIMAFLPLSGARNMHIMKAESPGPIVGKLVPKVRTTAKILYAIYFGLTMIEFVFLLCGKMPAFDALNAAFATAGTGGFSVKTDGFAGYSPYLQWVVTVFMLLFSINFNTYFLILCGKIKDAFNLEVRVFIGIVVAAIALITLNVYTTATELYSYTFSEALRYSAFSLASVISTTGFATANFDLWPSFSKCILVLVMFIGACAGSTGGGIKVSRVVVLYKGATHEMRRALHPKQMKKISMDGRIVEHEVVRNTNAFIIIYILVFIVSMLLVMLDPATVQVSESPLVTNFTATAATLNNIGPGLDAVGPVGNFAFYNPFSKIVFIFNMLAGRLELFPMLILFHPATWKK
ncbi:MAG: TrkH family potassium uptake protein [Clostridia bacterium]|nr:TrkH family potassium uptake protein [Clostridia bacterium]